MTIDTTNLCSHLQKKLFEPEGVYYPIWQAMQNDEELTAVVRSRQLHIYRNGKKILILAGKAQPKIIREDKLNELIIRQRTKLMNFPEVYSATGMMELIQQIGFLPLLDSGIEGFSAEDIVAEDCGYVRLPEGGWDWPLWKWKGAIVQEMPCMYGKFFNKKAGFISQEWWPDFCNYRRSNSPRPDEESIEGAILSTLQSSGSLITRELRAACGFTGKGMRSKFDGYLTRLEMATYIVTEDFIYPRDKHNHEYGWGWSLLNTPEDLYGREACQCNRTPQESYQRIFEHLKEILPDASDKQIIKLIG